MRAVAPSASRVTGVACADPDNLGSKNQTDQYDDLAARIKMFDWGMQRWHLYRLRQAEDWLQVAGKFARHPEAKRFFDNRWLPLFARRTDRCAAHYRLRHGWLAEQPVREVA